MTVSFDDSPNDYPVIGNLKDFDCNSGNWLERTIFNHRRVVLVLFLTVAAILGVQATHLVVNANFERMIPRSHSYIKNYLDNKGDLRGLGNSLRIAVENTQGDIYDPEYLKVLREVNDTVYLMPGVDRPWMKSLWLPFVRWAEVTPDGFDGGPVMPERFEGTPEQIEHRTSPAAGSLR